MPDEWSQYAEKSQPDEWDQYAEKAEPKPGWLDRTNSAITDTLAPNPQNYSSLARTNAIEVPKTLGREVYEGGKTIAGMIPGLYHSIVDKPTAEEAGAFGGDRLKTIAGRVTGITPAVQAGITYADPKTRPTLDQALSVLPEAIGQGAGTVVAGKLAEVAAPKVVAAAKNVPAITKTAIAPAVRSAGKFIEAATTPEIVGRTVGGTAGGLVGSATKIPHAGVIGAGVGEELGGAVGRNIGSKPIITAPRMRVYGYGEPAPGLRAVPEGPAAPEWLKSESPKTAPIERDATRQNVPYAGEEEVAPISETPKPNTNAIAYRARDVGEQGVPYRPESHAQATRFKTQAEGYMEGRQDIHGGKRQEVVGIDLSQAPGFSVPKNNSNWIKFHGEVPESAVSQVGAGKPAITVDDVAGQVEKGLGGFEPQRGKPIYPQTPPTGEAAPKVELPSDFTPSKDSSWVSGYKYIPEENELEFITDKGTHHVLGDVRPEQHAELKTAKSVGAAINKIRKTSPDVAKYINGKRVSVKPAER